MSSLIQTLITARNTSPYVSEEAKQNLLKYKPSTQQDYSFISKLLNPYWNFVANHVPDWVAPNTLTFVGFVAVVVAFGMTVMGLGGNDSTLPLYMYVVNALTLFWYQTMDAIDGKHARRTKTSSPLGELFDHGCDSVNSLMQTVLVLAALQLCNSDEDVWISFVTLIVVNVMFFISIWQQYYTSVLNFQNFSGPTEGQFVVMIVNLLAGVFGPQLLFNRNLVATLWNAFIQTPITDDSPKWLIAISSTKWLKVNYIVICCVLITTIPSIAKCIVDTLKSIKEPDLEDGGNGPTKADRTPVWKSLCSYAIFSGVFVVWMIVSALSSAESLLHTHLLYVLYTFGMFHAYIVTRFILARVCDLPIQSFMAVVYLPMIALLHSTFTLMNGQGIIEEIYFLKFIAVFITVAYVHMAYDVITNLTEFLGIYCFSVEKRPSKMNLSPQNSKTPDVDID